MGLRSNQVDRKSIIPVEDYSAQVARVYRSRRVSAPRRISSEASPVAPTSKSYSTEELRRRAISGYELLRSRSKSPQVLQRCSPEEQVNVAAVKQNGSLHKESFVRPVDVVQSTRQGDVSSSRVVESKAQVVDLTREEDSEEEVELARDIEGKLRVAASQQPRRFVGATTLPPVRRDPKVWSLQDSIRVRLSPPTQQRHEQQLTPEEVSVINDVWDLEKDESVVICKRNNVQFTRKDLCTLRDGEWLNDEVINFFTTAVMEQLRKRHGDSANVYIWSTHFYAKLVENDVYSYANVRRWTKRVASNVLQFRKIIFPIHIDIHWALAVADIDKQQLAYYDSLGHNNQPCLTNLLRWIRDETMDKTGLALDTSTWDFVFPKNIPQQENSCDCGMFLCQVSKRSTWVSLL